MFHNIKNAIEPAKDTPQLSITPVSVPCQAAFTIFLSHHVVKDEPNHTVDTEFSVTNFCCLHFSEHAQWGLPVMSDILVKIFVDISCNICGLFLL